MDRGLQRSLWWPSNNWLRKLGQSRWYCRLRALGFMYSNYVILRTCMYHTCTCNIYLSLNLKVTWPRTNSSRVLAIPSVCCRSQRKNIQQSSKHSCQRHIFICSLHLELLSCSICVGIAPNGFPGCRQSLWRSLCECPGCGSQPSESTEHSVQLSHAHEPKRWQPRSARWCWDACTRNHKKSQESKSLLCPSWSLNCEPPHHRLATWIGKESRCAMTYGDLVRGCV